MKLKEVRELYNRVVHDTTDALYPELVKVLEYAGENELPDDAEFDVLGVGE